MIKFENVSKIYENNVKALSDINIEIGMDQENQHL